MDIHAESVSRSTQANSFPREPACSGPVRFFPPLRLCAKTTALLRREDCHNASTVHGGTLFELAYRLEFRRKLFDQFEAFVHVGVFAATKDDREDDLVLLAKELFGAIHLGHEVGVADLRAEANLFVLAVVRMTFMLSLLLLVLELAVIHDPANWRLLGRRDFHQVESNVAGAIECFFGWDDPELFSFFRNHTNRGNADLLIDPLLLAFDFQVSLGVD